MYDLQASDGTWISGWPGQCGVLMSDAPFTGMYCGDERDVSLVLAGCLHEHMTWVWACGQHREPGHDMYYCTECLNQPREASVSHSCPVIFRPASQTERQMVMRCIESQVRGGE